MLGDGICGWCTGMKVGQLVSCLCSAGLGYAFIQPRVFVAGPAAAPCRKRQRTSSWPVWAVKDNSGPADLKFSKYHGIGNDFILVDNRGSSEPVLSPEQSQQLCDRNFGIGGDGVIFALPGKDGTDYSMRIYNSDGSEPEMCGNGIRCLAKFLLQLEGNEAQDDRTFNIWTLCGVMRPVVRTDGLVTVDMGAPILEGPKVPTTLPPTDDGRVIEAPLEVAGKTWKVTAVSMGNPHAVVFVDDVAALDLHGIGPQFEKHPVFPKKTNTEFVQVMGPQLLKMRVWERGAGPTLACGTGACALVVAANLAGKIDSRTCTVQLPGGDLEIEWRESDGRVYMTGPADLVFSGQIASR